MNSGKIPGDQKMPGFGLWIQEKSKMAPVRPLIAIALIVPLIAPLIAPPSLISTMEPTKA